MQPSFKYKAHIIKVTDGDTVLAELDLGFNTFRKEKLRLYGVDCPETRTKDPVEKKLGLKAKAWTKEQVEGKDVVIQSEKQGKFGRFLARVYLDDLCINDELIKRGMAKAYYGGSRNKDN